MKQGHLNRSFLSRVEVLILSFAFQSRAHISARTEKKVETVVWVGHKFETPSRHNQIISKFGRARSNIPRANKPRAKNTKFWSKHTSRTAETHRSSRSKSASLLKTSKYLFTFKTQIENQSIHSMKKIALRVFK